MPGAISQFETMSFDDFEELLLDKPDNERWELIGGRVIRGMVGARWEHHAIAQNVLVALRAHIKATGRPCRVFQESFYLKSKMLDLAVLPDIMVRCGPMQPGATSVPDPSVVVEVMSPGSEGRDRYEKWNAYQSLGSLQHYVLIHRDKPMVEVRSRSGNGWTTALFEGLNGTLALPAIAFEMPLTAVYEDVLSG